MRQLKRLLRYVKGTEDMSTVFEMRDNNDRRGQTVKRLEVYTDSDWASDQVSRKSTSCAVIVAEGMRLHAHSRVQASVAWSSCEAEVMAASEGIKKALLLQEVLMFVGLGHYEIEIKVDSSAAHAFFHRRGVGRMKPTNITEVPEVPLEYIVIDYGLEDMEPKSELMSLPQWDGDPSGCRDYQQEVRLYETGENLEINWSVAARLIGGLRGTARRVGLAMTDQELLPTARNITDNLERKADRNHRGIEALMTRLEAEFGQQRPQKKGESLEMFCASNKLQRKRGECITDYITSFEQGIKTLQDNDINLLTIDDVPGWILMRKASWTQERRERLIAALPDEHFAINDVKHVLVRLFLELHISEHRESDGYSRRRSRNDHTGPSSAYQRREQTSYPRRYRSTLALVS